MVARPDSLDAMLADFERRLGALETAERLTNSSMRNGTLRFLDDSSAELVRLDNDGLQIAAGSITVAGATVDAVSAAQNDAAAANYSSITTTPAAILSADLSVPAWANTALVLAIVSMQLTNSTGGSQQMRYRTDIDGVPGSGFASFDVPNLSTKHGSNHRGRIITGASLGSTISVDGVFAVDVGTSSANSLRLTAVAVFLRA